MYWAPTLISDFVESSIDMKLLISNLDVNFDPFPLEGQIEQQVGSVISFILPGRLFRALERHR